jgi:hypothetical protein
MHATASLPMKAQTVFATPSLATEASSLVQDHNPEPLSIREYANFVHAFVAGLCLEGVLALCLYGVYHIGHVVR